MYLFNHSLSSSHDRERVECNVSYLSQRKHVRVWLHARIIDCRATILRRHSSTYVRYTYRSTFCQRIHASKLLINPFSTSPPQTQPLFLVLFHFFSLLFDARSLVLHLDSISCWNRRPDWSSTPISSVTFMTIAVSRMDVSGRLVKYDLRRFFFLFFSQPILPLIGFNFRVMQPIVSVHIPRRMF